MKFFGNCSKVGPRALRLCASVELGGEGISILSWLVRLFRFSVRFVLDTENTLPVHVCTLANWVTHNILSKSTFFCSQPSQVNHLLPAACLVHVQQFPGTVLSKPRFLWPNEFRDSSTTSSNEGRQACSNTVKNTRLHFSHPLGPREYPAVDQTSPCAPSRHQQMSRPWSAQWWHQETYGTQDALHCRFDASDDVLCRLTQLEQGRQYGGLANTSTPIPTCPSCHMGDTDIIWSLVIGHQGEFGNLAWCLCQ